MERQIKKGDCRYSQIASKADRKTVFTVMSSFVKNKIFNIDRKTREQFIYYDLVGFDPQTLICRLRCLNSVNEFYASIPEITNEQDILFYMHPAHACFVGIEYGRIMKSRNVIELQEGLVGRSEIIDVSRYGSFLLTHKDRKGRFCFMNKRTEEKFSMNGKDIALSSDVINEFDAKQAFFIGVDIGLQIGSLHTKRRLNRNQVEIRVDPIDKKPRLKLVKNHTI